MTTRRSTAAAWTLALALTTACCARSSSSVARSGPAPQEPLAAIADAGDALSSDARATALAPLDGEWLHPISPEGHLIARVSMPLGATEPRPWMIALHGAGDRAEWACAAWHDVTAAYPFIVCPHGDRSGYYYDAPKDTTAAVMASIGALREELPDRVAPGHAPILAGFSMGATEAVILVRTTTLPTPPVLVLIEGAYDLVVQDGLFPALKKKGVTKLLLACTTAGGCPKTYAEARTRAEKAGLDAKFLQAGRKDHGMYPEVTEALAREWPWLTSGLEGFTTHGS